MYPLAGRLRRHHDQGFLVRSAASARVKISDFVPDPPFLDTKGLQVELEHNIPCYLACQFTFPGRNYIRNSSFPGPARSRWMSESGMRLPRDHVSSASHGLGL
jgi:hypothetical protein